MQVSYLPFAGAGCARKTQKIVQSLINAFKIKNPLSITLLWSFQNLPKKIISSTKVLHSVYIGGVIFPARWPEWLNCSLLFSDDSYYNGWKKEYLHTLKLVTCKSEGKHIILKSPQNTERVRYLLELFPNSKFIYIYRNPFHQETVIEIRYEELEKIPLM